MPFRKLNPTIGPESLGAADTILSCSPGPPLLRRTLSRRSLGPGGDDCSSLIFCAVSISPPQISVTSSPDRYGKKPGPPLVSLQLRERAANKGSLALTRGFSTGRDANVI